MFFIVLFVTFFDHSNSQALLKPTVLTSIAASLVHRTIFVSQTNVFRIFLNSTLKKTFTAFARTYTVMLASSIIAAYSTQLIGWHCFMCITVGCIILTDQASWITSGGRGWIQTVMMMIVVMIMMVKTSVRVAVRERRQC